MKFDFKERKYQSLLRLISACKSISKFYIIHKHIYNLFYIPKLKPKEDRPEEIGYFITAHQATLKKYIHIQTKKCNDENKI